VPDLSVATFGLFVEAGAIRAIIETFADTAFAIDKRTGRLDAEPPVLLST
jgi:hypothetical protein